MATIAQEGESSRANDQSLPRPEFTQRQHEVTLYDEGESGNSNYPSPIREFTQQELSIIENDVVIYSAEAKKLQEEADRQNTRCIYRVLSRYKENNGNSLYEPNMVSIGPYYYNLRKEELKMAEDCKIKCLDSLLLKDKDQDMQIQIYKSCMQRISSLEAKIQNCYSEVLEVTGFEFIKMIVVDACFIIEIFDMFGPRKEVDSGKALTALEGMVPYFYMDFLLLENQIPFFVLEEIYTITHKVQDGKISKSHLIFAALEFFKNGMKKFDLDIFDFISTNERKTDQYSALHLLDLVRSSLIPKFYKQPGLEFPSKTTSIHCVSKLLQAGIKVNPVKAQSFLDVKFKEGAIEMPNIAINDLMRCLLLNCVAFEQRNRRSGKYFSVYATFLDCLVKTPEDIEYLRKCNVIDNYLADDSKAADFINNAGKDLVLNTWNGFYLGKLFEGVDEHYRKKRNRKVTTFEEAYSNKSWLFLSALGGGILFVLGTLVQATVASLTYKYKK